ncbi:Predicted membrane chloride channel, bestrophin family [Gulbenkiania indica]|uniref:Predicted membrane chloride channel, bestrophin family n=1 Tax=Gulbenkiania indica TaxID=375574 RepID=A0A0K6GSM3_9NEIS|nr:bestrophin family ion channel [Gulbenkiania indica]CUA81526.1 Predicted membrane chloride channel, bestrophin family [Gulbenkiania indica]
MIVRSHHHWLHLLFTWRGSVLQRLGWRLLWVLLVSVISVLCSPWWLAEHAGSALGIPPFTLMGVALAIFLGFRNTASYDRFWEARKLWGTLVIFSRSLVREVASFAPSPEYAEARTRIARGVAAFSLALKHQLRGSDASADLVQRLPPEAMAGIGSAHFKPSAVLLFLGHEVAALWRQGAITDLQLQSLNLTLNTLSEVLGGCERIANTPIPYTYRVLIHRTVMGYCLLLPLGLASSIGWLTPLIAGFVAYAFLALDAIAEEIEEPFGEEPNDLALGAMCYTIEASVCELVGVAPLAEVPRPVGDVLL